jgi:hypothetical protein
MGAKSVFPMAVLLCLALPISSCGGGDGGDGGDDRRQLEPPLGNNALLSSLSVNGASLAPDFSPTVADYTAEVAYSTLSTSVTATSEDPNAGISVNGTELVSGIESDPISLDVGSNSLTVNVTAEDGTTSQTYNVYVTRQTASTDASLASLELGSWDLDPVFNAAATQYRVFVYEGTSSIDISATPNDVNASITIDGGVSSTVPIEAGENTIVILVTAEDGTTTETYTIVAARPVYESVHLSALEIGGITTWSPPFDGVFRVDYRVSVTPFTNSIELTPTAGTAGATIRVNGAITESGLAAGPIAINDGSNWISVRVDAADAESVQYTLDVTRQSALSYSQTAYIKASNTDPNDQFGTSIALSGDGSTLAVGAPKEDSAARDVNGDQSDNSETDSGAVYVFTRGSGLPWSQQAYIKGNPNHSEGDVPWDLFGAGVALSGDGSTLAVGAPFEGGYDLIWDDLLFFDSPHGAFYTCARDRDVWFRCGARYGYPSGGSRFGSQVGLSSDGVTLSAWGGASISVIAAGAYLYTRSDEYGFTRNLEVDAPVDATHGSIALSGDGATLVLASSRDRVVNIFRRMSNDVWAQSTINLCYRVFAKCNPVYSLDVRVSESGDVLAVGGRETDGSANGLDGGAAVFLRGADGTWIYRTSVEGLLPEDLALSQDGKMLIVDGTYDLMSDDFGVPVTVVFTRDENDDWKSRALFQPYVTGADRYGSAGQYDYIRIGSTSLGPRLALSADGSTLAIGAPGEDSAATGIDGNSEDDAAQNAGAVLIFEIKEQ